MAGQFSQTTRSLSNDTSRLSILVWLVAGVLLAAWLVWMYSASITVYEISRRARLEIQQAPYPVTAQLASKVVAASLTVGAEVKAGDVLVRLDDSTERFRLNEEEVRLATLAPQIASLEREIGARRREKVADQASARAAKESAQLRGREADAAAEFARDYEQRIERLRAGGLVSHVEASRASADAIKAAASRDSLASDLGRLDMDAQAHVSQHDAAIESLRHQVASLEGEVVTTRATIARLQAEREKHLIRAPVDGRLGEIVVTQPGEYVSAGQKLATIIPSGELLVIAEFSPSLSLGRVRAGQRGRLRLDGFPWGQYGTLPVTVTRVASEIRDTTVRVEMRLDAVPDTVPMQHGLPGTAEVAVEQTTPATLVLRAAGLMLAGHGRPPDLVAEASQ